MHNFIQKYWKTDRIHFCGNILSILIPGELENIKSPIIIEELKYILSVPKSMIEKVSPLLEEQIMHMLNNCSKS